jgi:hypothetical protein
VLGFAEWDGESQGGSNAAYIFTITVRRNFYYLINLKTSLLLKYFDGNFT